MSRIHHREISLEDLVSRSELVLIVKTADPPRRSIQIPIGKDRKNQAAPDFVRVKVRCEVLAALSKHGAELVGKTLEIDGANWETRLSLHKRYYLQGVSVSPIYETYRAADAPDDADRDAPYIAFLRREDKDGFAFVVSGGTERLKNRAAVEELLRGKK